MGKFIIIGNRVEFESATREMDIASLPEYAHSRFERLDSNQVQTLNSWFQDNGIPAILSIQDSDFAFWLLGASQVEPTQGYDFKLGSGKDSSYYQCRNNARNRRFRDNRGLKADIAASLIGLGPVGHLGPDCEVLSLQHRLKLALQIWKETGIFPVFQVRVDIGLPVALSGTLDRNIPRKQSDQEFMDSEVFPDALLREFYPELEDLSKKRDSLTRVLVSVRSNVYSRMNGGSFHPSSSEQPTARLALETEALFGEHTLQRLCCMVDSLSFSDDGKKRPFAIRIPTQELVTCLVLSQLRNVQNTQDLETVWNQEEVETLLAHFIEASETGSDAASQFVRELVAWVAKKKVSKDWPTIDRLRFCGLVRVVGAILNESPLANYFPTETEAKNLKGTAKKPAKLSYPRFGGLDAEKEDDSNN